MDKFPYIFNVKLSVALVKRNQISTWAMRKSDFHMTHEEIIFKLLLFDNFLQNRLVNSYRNTISKWAVVFRYGNLFIPRVEKSSKISLWEKNPASRRPTALGRARFLALGPIFEDF